jgi:hypothetical protein
MFGHPHYSFLTALALAVLPLLLITAAAYAARRWAWNTRAVGRVFESRVAPVVAALVAAVVTWWAWGGAAQPGAIHDERAYLLQARIFAAGRWTAPSPPEPRFWEQMHVFVRPVTAAKYPPLHSALLAPGVALQLPGAVPLLMTGLTAGAMFWLARCLAGGWVAIFTWFLWTSSTTSVVWRATYLSQVTTGLLWIGALVFLVRWRRDHRARHMLAAVALLCGMALTRPLTAIALSAPAGLVLLADCVRQRRWRLLAGASALCVAIGSVVPIWSYKTFGDWRNTPYTAYSRIYFPFDTVGFGASDQPAAGIDLPQSMRRLGAEFRELHEGHKRSRLPLIVAERLAGIVVDLGHGWRVGLMVLFAAGVTHARKFTRFGALSAASLFVAYLWFAHPPLWTVYYFEIFPFIWFVVSLELWRVLTRIAGSEPAAARAAAILLLVFVPLSVSDVIRAHDRGDALRAFHRDAARRLSAIPRPAVVFVRDSDAQNHAFGLVDNHADVWAAPLWVVHDRANDNQALMARAPHRQAFLFDLADRRLWQIRVEPNEAATALPRRIQGNAR